MPTGTYDHTNVHCRQCEDKPSFGSLGELRKHQWAVHKQYKNIGKNRMPTVKLNGHVSAQDLLEKLKAQRDFITDAIDLVEGLMK